MAATTIESMMKAFHLELGSERLRWMMSHFSGTESLEDMFTFLWDFDEAHRHLKPNILPSGKSQTEAEKLQAEGDNYLKGKRLDEALEQYNLSIMKAPHPVMADRGKTRSNARSPKPDDCSVLAAGYAKRSAILFELGHFEQCLNDINLALALGSPDSLGDLNDRKEKCLNSKNNNLTENCEVSESSRSSLGVTLAGKSPVNIPKVLDPHPTMPALCHGVKMAFSAEKGRHIVAERDINPGEVVGVERSSSSSLDLANLTTHCSTCLMKCLAPLPCPDCSMVVFCSDACRTEGLSGDHWLECSLLPSMVVIGLQPVFSISFKLLKRYTCEQWRSSVQQLQECTKDLPLVRRGPTKNGLSSLRDFESIHYLVSNKELRPSGDLYVKCLIALLLTKLLQQSGKYFVNSSDEPVTPTREDLLFTGQLLFSHLLKISCNGFKLVEFQCSGHYSEMSKKDIGSGVFPVLCLFNHSCHPNCEPYSYGRIQVLKASRPIPAGTEITESYCRGFYLQPTAARQKSLMSVFQFQCTCEACEANWPTYVELPGTLQFKCLDCHQPVSGNALMCMKCFLDYDRKDYEPNKQLLVDEWRSTAEQVRRAFEKSQQIASKMMLGKPATEEDFNSICKAITVMEKHVPFPCQPLWDAHDALDLYLHLEREKVN